MKQFYRSKNDKMLAGICGGLGEYFQIDSNLMRILMALFILLTGIVFGVIAYFIVWLIIPEEDGAPVVNKRFYRSVHDKKIAGILGGFGEYLDMDPNILRVIYLFMFFLTGFLPLGILYLITWLIIPSQNEHEKSPDVEII